MFERDTLYIGGTHEKPSSSRTIEVRSPFTEEVVGRVPEAAEADVDRAVAAAREAFERGPWARMAPAERADVLDRLLMGLQMRSADIASTVTLEMGCPVSFAHAGQAFATTMVLQFYAELARTFPFEETRPSMAGSALVRQEPVGVAAAIVPWNVPLFTIMLKLAPALTAGCSIVVKPAPETPLDAYILADALDEAGVPKGVVSIVAGGRELGEHLVTHPGIDKVAFTGSTAAGRRIAALCGERLKRVTLELGGKSAAIVCDDADFDTVLPMVVGAGTMNNGQACVAQTRILLPRARYQEGVDALAAVVGGLKVGDPNDPTTEIGPLVAERQRDRVLGYVAKGKQEGARCVVGGGRPKGLDRGYFVEPTLFADVGNHMTVAREEIFGPVLCAIPYDDEADAIRIANDSEYGLSGSVWTNDPKRGIDIARRVRTGTHNVNFFMMAMTSPFGGFKSSGLGRELGPEGLRAYLEPKTICLAPGIEVS
ncbi:MAG: aldehyde dehydrogenase [Deltaproteobacteria bacterium]|nr:aldehyde dehydrogenase [Deltaproteobacteria bacterium]